MPGIIRRYIADFIRRYYRFFYFGVLFSALSVTLALYFYAPEETEEKKSTSLPRECDKFSLVSGNTKKDKIFIIGELHIHSQEAIECLLAMVEERRFRSFEVYHEGKVVNPDLDSKTGLCRRASACISWDDIPAAARVTENLYASFRVNAITKLKQMKQQFSRDRQFYEFLRGLRSRALSKDVPVCYLSGYERMALEAKNDLISLYEKHRKPEINFFDPVFAAFFENVRSQLPKSCNRFSDDELWVCYTHDASATDNKKRTESLKNRVREKRNLGGPAFFVGGKNHVVGVIKNEGAQQKTAILMDKRQS